MEPNALSPRQSVPGGLYAYIAQGSIQISVMSLSPSGELVKLQDMAVQGEIPADVRKSRFLSMTIAPDRRFLFATTRMVPYTVTSFAIDGVSGLLTRLGDAPLVDSAPFISTDRTGRFLFAAYNPPERTRRTGFVSVSVINNGFVQPPHQVIHTPPKTHAIRVDASNRFVFAPSCDGDVVVRFTFDVATGLLNPDALAPLVVRPKAGPRHCVFHPSNGAMYLLNEYDGSIYVYRFDPRDGAMSELQVASARPADFDKGANIQSGDLHISPDGKWVYAAVNAVSAIAVFRVDAETARLTPAGHFPVATWPRGFNLDPLGRHLVANGLDTGSVATYEIDPATGALSKIAEIGKLEVPNWIEIVRLP